MLVSMLTLWVRTHTFRTTTTEHQRVGILNSPKNLLSKMQWNKLLTIFLPWHLFFFYLYSSLPHLLADKNVIFGSSSVWAQECVTELRMNGGEWEGKDRGVSEWRSVGGRTTVHCLQVPTLLLPCNRIRTLLFQLYTLPPTKIIHFLPSTETRHNLMTKFCD